MTCFVRPEKIVSVTDLAASSSDGESGASGNGGLEWWVERSLGAGVVGFALIGFDWLGWLVDWLVG